MSGSRYVLYSTKCKDAITETIASLMQLSRLRIALWAVAWAVFIVVAVPGAGLNGWPWRLQAISSYVVNSPYDIWIKNAFAIEQLRAERDHDQRYILMGGSICVDAVTTDQEMEKRLSSTLQRGAQFTSLCSFQMSFTDVAKIIDRVGAFNGKILLLVDPLTFRKRARSELVLKSKNGNINPKYYFLKIPDEMLSAVNKECGGYTWYCAELNYIKHAPAQLFNLFTEGATNFIKGKTLTYNRHIPIEKRKLRSEDALASFVKKLPGLIAKNKDHNFLFLRKVLDLANRKGVQVLIVDHPYPSILDGIYPNYDKDIRLLTEDYAIKRIDVRPEGGWTRDHFVDGHHLNPKGQHKFMDALSAEILKLETTGAGQ